MSEQTSQSESTSTSTSTSTSLVTLANNEKIVVQTVIRIPIGGTLNLHSLLISVTDGAGRSVDPATIKFVQVTSWKAIVPDGEIDYELPVGFDLNKPGSYIIEFQFGDPYKAFTTIEVYNPNATETIGGSTSGQQNNSASVASSNANGQIKSSATSGLNNVTSSESGQSAKVASVAAKRLGTDVTTRMVHLSTSTSANESIPSEGSEANGEQGGISSVGSAGTQNNHVGNNSNRLPNTEETSEDNGLIDLGLTGLVTSIMLVIAKRRRKNQHD